MAPPFIYRVDEIRQRTGTPSRRNGSEWQPPRPHGANQRQQRGPWILNTGREGMRSRILSHLPSQPPAGCEHYASASLYYSGGSIWGVPYDASNHRIGDGTQDSRYQEDNGDEADSSSSGASDEDDGDDGDDERYQDWQPLSFAYPQPYRVDQPSYVGLGLEYPRLHVHRDDQLRWIDELLPDRYHSPYHRDVAGYGGMVGSLPILIGLIALSVPPEQVTETVAACITGNQWRLHGLPRGRGRMDRRGIAVHTYTYRPSPESTHEALEAFEHGRVRKVYS